MNLTLFLLMAMALCSFGQAVPPQTLSHVEQGQDCEIVRAVLTTVMGEARTVGVEGWGFRMCYFFVSEQTPGVHESKVPRTQYFMSEDERWRFRELRETSAFLSLLERGAEANQWCHCELPSNFSFMPESALPEDILEPDPRFTWGSQDFYVDGVFRVAFPGVSEDECSAIVYVWGAHFIWQTWKAYYLENIEGQWAVREEFLLYMEGE